MTRLAIVLLAVVASCAQIDRGRCLRSHTRPGFFLLMPITNCNRGSCTTTFIPIWQPPAEVCDQWEFPEGRPKQ